MRKEYGYPTLEAICKASAGNETAIKEIVSDFMSCHQIAHIS